MAAEQVTLTPEQYSQVARNVSDACFRIFKALPLDGVKLPASLQSVISKDAETIGDLFNMVDPGLEFINDLKQSMQLVAAYDCMAQRIQNLIAPPDVKEFLLKYVGSPDAYLKPATAQQVTRDIQNAVDAAINQVLGKGRP